VEKYDGIKSGWVQEMASIISNGGMLRYVSFGGGDIHPQFAADLRTAGAGYAERWLPRPIHLSEFKSFLGQIKLPEIKLLAH